MSKVAFIACECARVLDADGFVEHARASHPACEGSQRVREALASLDALAKREAAREAAGMAEEERARRPRGFVVRKARSMFADAPHGHCFCGEPLSKEDSLDPRVEDGECPKCRAPRAKDATLLTEDWFTGFVPRDERQPDSQFEGRDGAMVTQAQAQLDLDTLRWCRRDEFEMHREAKRRSERGGSVEGDRHAPGLAGEREWLAAQLREIERRFQAGELAREEAARHATALRARFNCRRHVEALGGDPDAAEVAAWRAKHKLSWARATERLAARIERKFLEGELETLAVPGLISERPRRRAPQFARPKMTSKVQGATA